MTPCNDYHRPRSVEEALRLRAADPRSRFIAGGTDVMVEVRSGLSRPTALISLRHRRVAPHRARRARRAYRRHDHGGRARRAPGLRARYPVLAQAASGSAASRSATSPPSAVTSSTPRRARTPPRRCWCSARGCGWSAPVALARCRSASSSSAHAPRAFMTASS